MEYQLLESAEFYQRRYKNFSTLVIFPVLIFILGAVGFASFGTKEIVVKSRAEIVPTTILSRVHSSSSQEIAINNLEQNGFIEEGEELLTYQNGVSELEIRHIESQLEEKIEQQAQVGILIQALEGGEQVTFSDVHFGYEQILSDYQAQISQFEKATNRERTEIEQQNNQVNQIKAAIDLQIQEMETKKIQYQELKQTVEQNNDLDEDHSLYTLSQVYKDQLNNEEIENEKDAIKNQIVIEIESQIEQFENSLSSYRTQRSSAGVVTSSDSSLEAQKKALTAQYLLQAKQEQVQVATQISELESTLSIQNEQLNRQILVSPTSGILQINEEIVGSKIIPEGTLVAEIYPVMTEKEAIHVVTYITSQDISDIHLGDNIRFRILKGGLVNGQELNGEIIEIDAAATRTEQGNFYKVTAEAMLNEETEDIRYGLEGEAIIITGQTTFLRYYVDRFLNN